MADEAYRYLELLIVEGGERLSAYVVCCFDPYGRMCRYLCSNVVVCSIDQCASKFEGYVRKGTVRTLMKRRFSFTVQYGLEVT